MHAAAGGIDTRPEPRRPGRKKDETRIRVDPMHAAAGGIDPRPDRGRRAGRARASGRGAARNDDAQERLRTVSPLVIHWRYRVCMLKKLTKHGNSLALVIDRPILDLLKIEPGTTLDVSTDG